MRPIDTNNWREFRIGDWFETIKNGTQVPTGASIPKLQLKENGSIPRITVSGINNGVIGLYDYLGNNEASYRIFNNFISVSFLGTVFYQSGCASLDMKVHCLKPLNVVLNEYTGNYLVAAIRASLRLIKYDDQLTSTLLPNLKVKLPSTPEGTPNWVAMEDYMKVIELQAKKQIESLSRYNYSKRIIDIEDWREYIIGDLFPNIVKPEVYHTREVVEDESGIPYIVRSKYKNGIKYRVRKDGIQTSPGGVISFGAENSAFFYQEEEWCSGRDIYYIDTRKVSKMACRFIISCLSQIARKYTYSYGLFPELIMKEKIKLPAKGDEPDWHYMEMYMRGVEAIAKEKIALLTKKKQEPVQQTSINNFGTVNIYEK